MDGSTGFTCVTCRVVFETAELQRDHYKTEWHRYNLKRQAAELPAIGFELFNEKQASFNPTKPAVSAEIEPLYCKACRKSIKSENAMTDHLASKKHKDMEKKSLEEVKKGPKQPRKKPENMPKKPEADEKMEQDENDEDDDSSGWETDDGEEGMEELNEDEALPVTSCLFCPQTKPNVEEMRKHMNFHHGFQLPDRQYLVDELGCLNYLGLKIGAGRCCIYCPDSKARYDSIQSCQQHMRDKEHCKVRRDPTSMIELDDYYDYSPMYEGDEDKNDSELFDDGWSLTLPSGAKIGHRHLHRYFKQYLKPVDGTQRIASRAAIDKARGFYPALAWTGTTTVEAKKVARDMKFVERFRRRFDLRVAVKSNKLFKTRGFVGDNH
ncbi:Protein CBG19691 [Caenorhabditis briggsae]|uniref:Protein CBG19691 n=2 Tax=Caenorhabditis briggsae TaxID=6238 RepID=A8XW76_CAEBR|nr:Protein CBG19691 [Caenorhabditis briggsae]ULT99355.1 hypothetical protein L3Y34_000595 [Caenorhabditis briggsae]CAP36895.1 Protein CBG19691 [Caenorhabditis briggsae]